MKIMTSAEWQAAGCPMIPVTLVDDAGKVLMRISTFEDVIHSEAEYAAVVAKTVRLNLRIGLERWRADKAKACAARWKRAAKKLWRAGR